MVQRLTCGMIILCLGLAPLFGAEAPADSGAQPEVTPQVLQSIDKACGWLARQQGKDGGLNSQYSVAATALAGLAWLGSGSTPDSGPYARNVTQALRFILNSQSKNGFVSEGRNYGASMMYGHGYSTQFLAEAYGMVRDPDLADEVRQALQKSTRLLETTQNTFGGWNSSPNAQGSDDGSGAVAIMQISALRAAESCGVYVKTQTISKSKKYLLEMTNNEGWYAYNWHARSSGRGSPGTTAAGMYMLGAMGLHADPRYAKGIKNLMATSPFMKTKGGWGEAGGWGWYYYTCFYASLAIFQHGGEEWRQWYPAMVTDLLKKQRPDGGWDDGYGGVMTGLAALCLELPLRYLPMFQEGGAGMDGR